MPPIPCLLTWQQLRTVVCLVRMFPPLLEFSSGHCLFPPRCGKWGAAETVQAEQGVVGGVLRGGCAHLLVLRKQPRSPELHSGVRLGAPGACLQGLLSWKQDEAGPTLHPRSGLGLPTLHEGLSLGCTLYMPPSPLSFSLQKQLVEDH